MSDPDDFGAAAGRGQLDQEAATWCVRMHGDEAAHWRDAFEDWLRRGALHRRAYNRMEEIYLLGAKLRGPASTPLPDPPATGAAVRGRRTGPLVASALLGALACATLAFGLLNHGSAPSGGGIMPAPNGPARLAATENGPARFRLADGSQLLLDRNSIVRVSYSPARRVIDLEQGAGRFAVAHDTRPFTVWAGGGAVTARGTLFDVRNQAGRQVEVHLLRGAVDVTFPPAADGAGGAPRVTRMTPGQRVSFAVGDRSDPAHAAAVGDARAQQPDTVGALIDLANATPGATTRIVLADRTIRDIRLSGSFRVHGPAIVADRLATMLGLIVDRSQGGELLLHRASAD